MSETMTRVDLVGLAKAARLGARTIADLDTATKNKLLHTMADRLEAGEKAIIEANERDVTRATGNGLSKAMIDRLVLDSPRVRAMADALREVAGLPDPVGRVTGMSYRPNGIQVGQVHIPLGVICMIYESRPNVTVDAAGLCLKSGNAIILRGGSEAFESNTAIAKILHEALEAEQLPTSAVTLVPTTDRKALAELLLLEQYIDLVIPRGGEGLIRFVNETSRIPVIKHYKGVCHLYVDKEADQEMAIKLLIDGKTSRPGVCNALETMLVHADIAGEFLRRAAQALGEHGVEVRGCGRTRSLIICSKERPDFHTEYLDLILSVRVVDTFYDALSHIHEYSSNHTEVIVTENIHTARRFQRRVNSSVVMVNASSRFSDGGQLGLGAEIGISTTKLHAYGPMGLESLTTRKFIVMGEGQTRH